MVTLPFNSNDVGVTADLISSKHERHFSKLTVMRIWNFHKSQVIRHEILNGI